MSSARPRLALVHRARLGCACLLTLLLLACPAGYSEYTGSASAGGSDQVTPTFRDSGTFNGILTCSGADLDLYLDRMRNNGNFRNTVASSTSAGCNEEITYTNNRTRNYRWRVSAYSGSTNFTLCVNKD